MPGYDVTIDIALYRYYAAEGEAEPSWHHERSTGATPWKQIESYEFTELPAGDYYAVVKEYFDEQSQSESEKYYFTVPDSVTYPTLDVQQTGADTVDITVSGDAAEYAVVYHVIGLNDAGIPVVKVEDTMVTVKNGKTLTLKGLEEKDTVTAKAGAQAVWNETTKSYDFITDSITGGATLINWEWATKPTVTVKQDMTTEGRLDVTFSNDAYRAYDTESHAVAYEIVTAAGTIVAYVTNENGEYILTDKDNHQIGSGYTVIPGENRYWTVHVDGYTAYDKSKKGDAKTDVITVTPLIFYAGEVEYTGTTGSVKYDRTRFVNAAWTAAPDVYYDVEENKAEFRVALHGGATDGAIKIGTAEYQLSKLIGNPIDGVKVEKGTIYSYIVTVTFGGDTMKYDTAYKFSFAALDPSESASLDNKGTYSSAISVKIAKKPAWISKKITVKVTQADDDTLNVTFTNLNQFDTNKSLEEYLISFTGKDGDWTQIFLDDWTLDAKGKNYTGSISVSNPSYTDKTTVYIMAVGSNYVDPATTGYWETAVGSGSVTMKKLWATKPTVKAVASSTSRIATVTVTGKGNPDSFLLEWSDGSSWNTLDIDYSVGSSKVIDDYQTRVTITGITDCTVTYQLTLATDEYYNYTKALYLRATPKKGSESGTTSAKASVKIAPAWTTKALKLTLKQTAEDTLTVTWPGIATANVYQLVFSIDGTITKIAAGTYNEKTKTWSAVVNGLEKGKEYKVEVTPIYDTPTMYDIGLTATTTFTLTDLWQKTPVVSKLTTDGITVSGKVTYYGQPEVLTVYITGPDGYENKVTFNHPDAAGIEGKDKEFKFFVRNEKDSTYLPGTYTVTAVVSDGAETPTEVTSKAVKATVKEAFMANGAKVKSVVQKNEQEFTVTLSKALAKNKSDDRGLWVDVYYVDASGETQPVYQYAYEANDTVFDITLPESLFATIDLSTLMFKLTPLATYDDTYGAYGTSMIYGLTKLKSDYWKAQPTMKVTQTGHETIEVTLTNAKAKWYWVTVTDLANHCEQCLCSSNSGYVATLALGSDMDLQSTLYVEVEPAVSDATADVSGFIIRDSIVLNHDWNTITNVALADLDGKKGDWMKVTYSYNAPADGVYVQLLDATTLKPIGEPVAVPAEKITLNTAKKTALLTIEAEISGKYYVTVTPYLADSETEAITTIGDTVQSKKAASLAIPASK